MLNEYVVLDLEMTGLSAKTDQIIEIGAIKIKDNKIVERFGGLVNPSCKVPTRVVELTGITDEMVQQGMDKDEAISKLLDFIITASKIDLDYEMKMTQEFTIKSVENINLKLANFYATTEQNILKIEELINESINTASKESFCNN